MRYPRRLELDIIPESRESFAVPRQELKPYSRTVVGVAVVGDDAAFPTRVFGVGSNIKDGWPFGLLT